MQEPGSGVSAVIDGRRVSVGTLEWLSRQGAAVVEAAGTAATSSEQQQPGPSSSAAGVSEPRGDRRGGEAVAGTSGHDGLISGLTAVLGVGSSHSRVYVSVDDSVVGSIDVQDSVRGDAARTVADLHRQVGLALLALTAL